MSHLICLREELVAVKLEEVYLTDDSKVYEVNDTFAIQQQQQQQICWQTPAAPPQTQQLESFKLDEEACQPTVAAGFNKPKACRKGKRLLWQFLLHELLSGRSDLGWHPDQLKNPGVFAFKDPNAAARRWGSYKENENMSYEKMSRCIRDYYARPSNRHFGVMQPDVQNVTNTTSGSDSGSRSSIVSGALCSRRKLHFAFNLKHPCVVRYIRQYATAYYHRLFAMKLV